MTETDSPLLLETYTCFPSGAIATAPGASPTGIGLPICCLPCRSIAVGGNPYGMAITPDGKWLYVANQEGYASVIETASNQVVGSPITLGKDPSGVAISPNGTRAYVSNYEDGTVSVIDTATRQVIGSPIVIGEQIEYLAVTPDGGHLLAEQFKPSRISVVDTASNQIVGTPMLIQEGKTELGGIAIVPDQSPAASFSHARARPGVPVALNGSASSDPDGTVTSFAWQFGDRKSATTTAAKASHKYAKPGTYTATLTVTDNENCSSALVFTGQTASCSGSAAAIQTQKVKVAYPGVRVRCPASAKGRCRFKLKAVVGKGKGKKRKLKAQSAVARAKAKPGKAVVISLKPKKAFAKKLATARKALVQEIVTIDGTTTTKLKKLKIVQ